MILDWNWFTQKLDTPWRLPGNLYSALCYVKTPNILILHNPLSSVQSLSHVRLFATPWIAASQASLSITNSRSSLRLTSIESVMPSSRLILGRPLLLQPPIPPSIRVFSNESTFRMGWPKYWSFSFSIMGRLALGQKCICDFSGGTMNSYNVFTCQDTLEKAALPMLTLIHNITVSGWAAGKDSGLSGYHTHAVCITASRTYIPRLFI